jgi:hypothetical protein
MTGKCEWCKGEIQGALSKCAGCNTLITAFFGMIPSQIPNKADLRSTNSILEPSRGLDETQRFLNLANEVGSENELPRAFRARRGRQFEWNEDDIESWRGLRRTINKWGDVPPIGFVLKLPGGAFLRIEEGHHFVDSLRLPNRLPLLDLADWLSNSKRVNSISDWPDFLLAMSCSVREIYPMEEDGWAGWNVNNSWRGVDVPQMGSQPPPGENVCPFMLFVGTKVAEETECTHDLGRLGGTAGVVARSRPEAIREVGGLASEAWVEIMEAATSFETSSRTDSLEMGRQFSLRVAPRLAVIDNKLHMVALENGRPGLVRVTVDARVWRTLVSWTFEPEGHPGSRLMRDLFYTWNDEDERLVPTRAQMNSAIMLRSTIEMLGERSSTEPVYYSEMATGIHVVGASGMRYLVYGTNDPHKFGVEAFPLEEHLADVRKHGLSVCIDPKVKRPAGDVAVAYLLALSNDIDSRQQIGTLDILLDIVSHILDEADATPSMVKVWWKKIREIHDCIVEHEDEEDYDEEEEDEDWVTFDEIDEEERIVAEPPIPPPQPERYEILLEMFEEAMRMGIDLRQNDEEVV